MAQYPDCPFCGNTSLSIVDVEIEGVLLKGVKCNASDCEKFIGFYKDYDVKIKEITDSIDELSGRIDELE